MRKVLWVCTAVLVAAAAAAQTGEPITLTSRDKGVVVSGELIDFDGEVYRLSTQFGPLAVDASGVTCFGDGCPDPSGFVAEITILGRARFLDGLARHLLEAFAKAESYGLGQINSRLYTLTDSMTGRDAARVVLVEADPTKVHEPLLGEGADFAIGYGAAWDVSVADRRLVRHVIALDALVPMVPPENALQAIAPADLGAILAGKLTSWSDLGTGEMPITVAALPPGRVPEILLRRIGVVPAPSEKTGTDPAMGDPFAISVTPLSRSEGLKPLGLLGNCGMVAPVTRDAIVTELYPMSMTVELKHGPARLPRIAREFLAFVLSDAAQPAVARAGLVDQSIGTVPYGAQADWLSDAVLLGSEGAGLATVKRMITDLRGAARLTLAFRFESGTSALDVHSLSNIARLARAIEEGRFDGYEVIVAGFSDSDGAAEVNQQLSRQRAEVVRRQLLAALTPPVDDAWRDRVAARGYGEAAPIACNDADWGRSANRRVEVWITQR